MYEMFEYGEIGNRIELIRYNGEKTEIIVPGFIEEKPVVKLSKYCFHNNRQLQKIEIPDSVEEIDGHCFYDCRNLRTICLSDRISSIGDGAFKNCWEVRNICLRKIINKRTCLNNILAELSQKLNVQMDYYANGELVQTAKVVFPKYALDYVDNVEARIINQVTYGSGVHYRECMKDKDIDYRHYDQTFQIAKVNDTVETLFEIAKCRISWPFALSCGAREVYLSYLKEKLPAIIDMILRKDRIEDLFFLGSNGLFTEENIETIIEIAHKMEKTESVGVLLDYKNKHFKPVCKRFDL